jgi:AAA family ATP:ADP antiporter
MGVTIFWVYANDVLGHERAKTVFGVLTAAGMSGGAAGAWITKVFVEQLGPVDIVLVAAGVFGLTMVVFAGLEVLTRGSSSVRTTMASDHAAADLRRLPEVIRQVRANRLLWLIALVVCFERVAPDMVDYVFQNTAVGFFPDKTSYASFFASFEMWRNIIVLAGTLIITPALLTYFGTGAAMITVPAAIVRFGAAMIAFPSLIAVVLLKGFEEGQRHSWFKAGKETLYTVTSREVLYTVKGYIEMFLYRFSRGIAGLLLLGMAGVMAALGRPESVTLLVLVVMIPMAIAWGWAVWQVDREYKTIVRGLDTGATTRRS